MLMLKLRIVVITVFISLLVMSNLGITQDKIPNRVLFKNVKIFDGTTDKLISGNDVLVEKNLIKEIAANIKAPEGATVINCGGRALMPGLIDSHVHLTHMLVQGGVAGFEGATWEEIGATTCAAAREMLMSGFTTVRDLGGMGTGFKRVIDRGELVGPRIYAAGAYISQTSGHGDLRTRSQLNMESNLQRLRIIKLVDGVPEVLKGIRENLAEGAAFCKLMVGGGVTSEKDPLHSEQFTDEEILAAVKATSAWDTYIAVHVYKADHVKRALNLGVKCIDHGHMMDEEAFQLLNEKEAFLSTNFAGFSEEWKQHPLYGNPDGPQYPKMMQFDEAKEKFKKLANKYKPKMVFNSDAVMNTVQSSRAIRDNAMFLHAQYMGNFETLKAMTSVGGELAVLTGENNPYPYKLGVVEEGAYADLLLIDGNPLEEITVLGANSSIFKAEPRGESIETIILIMKDGKIYKNTL